MHPPISPRREHDFCSKCCSHASKTTRSQSGPIYNNKKNIISPRRHPFFYRKYSFHLSESATFDFGFCEPFILPQREQHFAETPSLYLGESIAFSHNPSFYLSESTTFVLVMCRVPRWSPGKCYFTCARAAIDSKHLILPGLPTDCWFVAIF